MPLWQRGPGLRISAADREQALVRLTEALTDGRLEATEYPGAEERLQRAVTYADLDAIVGDLDARASLTERDQAVARIEAAVADGLLDPAEQHIRVEVARNATTDAQLAALVADLAAGPGTSSTRASNADREAVAARLQDAVEGGFLDVTEFDERVRAVYAARLSSELTRLVADLPVPTPPPPPPVETFRREWRHFAFHVIAFYGFFGLAGFLGLAGLMTERGLGGLAVLPVVGWLVGLVLVVRSQRRLVAVEPASPVAEVPGKRLLEGHKKGVLSLTCLVLPDGTPLAISGGGDNTARVWDLNDDSPRHTLSGHTDDVRGVAAIVLPDGSPVAVTVSGDRTARVWDLHDGSQRGTLPDLAEEPLSVACMTLADGTPVAVARGLHSEIQMWDLRDNTLLSDFGVDLFMDAMVPMVLPDGMPVAIASDTGGPMEVVNLKNRRMRSQLLGHTGTVRLIDATVLPDGTPVAVSVGGDKTIRVWDLRYGKLLHTIAGMIDEQVGVVCTSLPDGTPVVVACDYDEGAKVWDLRDGAKLPYRLDLRESVITGVALENRTLILAQDDDSYAIQVHSLA